jgi:hypothetical protein
MTGDPVLREAQHAETHAEPSDEELEKIARMPRSISPSDLEPNPSVSVGYPNRGLLRFGMRINDDRDLRVKVGSLDSRHGTGELVRLIESAAHEVAFRYPRAQLTVGDLSRPGGGRIRPHVSHQSGRDVDLGFYMLDRRSTPVNVHLFVRFNNQAMGKQWGNLYKFDASLQVRRLAQLGANRIIAQPTDHRRATHLRVELDQATSAQSSGEGRREPRGADACQARNHAASARRTASKPLPRPDLLLRRRSTDVQGSPAFLRVA